MNWNEPTFSMKDAVLLLIGVVIVAAILTVLDYLL